MSDLWAILYEEARNRWIEALRPDRDAQVALEEWIEQCLVLGPPGSSSSDPDEERHTSIANTTIEVVYYAFEHERLILVKLIS
ncbi:MAG: hypothetical protein ACRD1K_18970 [Acidimicrobiales bacterium]